MSRQIAGTNRKTRRISLVSYSTVTFWNDSFRMIANCFLTTLHFFAIHSTKQFRGKLKYLSNNLKVQFSKFAYSFRSVAIHRNSLVYHLHCNATQLWRWIGNTSNTRFLWNRQHIPHRHFQRFVWSCCTCFQALAFPTRRFKAIFRRWCLSVNRRWRRRRTWLYSSRAGYGIYAPAWLSLTRYYFWECWFVPRERVSKGKVWQVEMRRC